MQHELNDLHRQVLRLYEKLICRANQYQLAPGGDTFAEIQALAARALKLLGGVDTPPSLSLRDYQHGVFGPFLGISDDGSAGAAIRRAALDSPKMKVLGPSSPMKTGLALDAERLAAVGEVAVGPDEYRNIRLQCMGAILTSTNVGTRLNLRYYKLRPVLEVGKGQVKDVLADVMGQLELLVRPFWLTPDGKPRPLTVLVKFPGRSTYNRKKEVLEALKKQIEAGHYSDPAFHSLALLAEVGSGVRGFRQAMEALDLAQEIGLKKVAVDGPAKPGSGDRISLPGLLNIFSTRQVNNLVHAAKRKGIAIGPKNLVDTETVARHVWTGLQVARNMGLELGKYGLFPLTYAESAAVIEAIQTWFPGWTAAPVFYLDMPNLGGTRVYSEQNIPTGVREWLEIAAEKGVSVVLIDTADKDKGRRLLKRSRKDSVGILSLVQIRNLENYAKEKGIKVLWAGGIQLDQVFDLGKQEIFGLYVTTAVASLLPVTKNYAEDPMLFAQKKPTYEGVSRAKIMLEAGFISSRMMKAGRSAQAKAIESVARELASIIEGNPDDSDVHSCQKNLEKLLLPAWEIHFDVCGEDTLSAKGKRNDKKG